jgi:gamma-glutamylcyclotransferase (GGCT)/AIG2-like uncharacterized protein YtfP
MFERLFGRRGAGDDGKGVDRIFVYGTLMNLREVREMWGVEPTAIVKATVRGDLYSADSQPILMDGRGTVHGLLLTIPEMASDPGIFDKYEACHNNGPASFHFRVLREAATESGERANAWVYMGNPGNKAVAKAYRESNRIIEGKWTITPNRLHGPLE